MQKCAFAVSVTSSTLSMRLFISHIIPFYEWSLCPLFKDRIKGDLLFIYVNVCVYNVPTQARLRHQIWGKWSYRWLWSTQHRCWESHSSPWEGAAVDLDHGVISLEPHVGFFSWDPGESNPRPSTCWASLLSLSYVSSLSFVSTTSVLGVEDLQDSACFKGC